MLFVLMFPQFKGVSIDLVLWQIYKPPLALSNLFITQFLAQITVEMIGCVVLIQSVLVIEGFVVAEMAKGMSHQVMFANFVKTVEFLLTHENGFEFKT